MKSFRPLLAKTYGHAGMDGQVLTRAEASLLFHLTATYDASVALLDQIDKKALRAVGLSPEWVGKLRLLVRIAAAIHDIGKANEHFQEMIYRVMEDCSTRSQQAVRHEWVGLFRLLRPDFRSWFSSVLPDDRDWEMVLWLINGHHRKKFIAQEGCGLRLKLLAGNKDFREILEFIRKSFDLPEPPESLSQDVEWALTGTDDVESIHLEWEHKAARIFRGLNDDEKRFVSIAKAVLIAADISASAKSSAAVEFIKNSFVPLKKMDLQKIVEKRLDGRKLRRFQKLTAKSKTRVVILVAGCGTGKTVASYLFAEAREAERIFTCYPTTGTTTEGFRDYLFDPELKDQIAILQHCRSDMDWGLLLDPREMHDGDDSDDMDVESKSRRNSLETYTTAISCCTVDTVLGAMQNNKNGIYAFPSMCNAAFVFDEIHSYDDKLFGSLLEFIWFFRGLPILLMTATLPKARLDVINDVLKRIGEPTAEVIRGPRDLETCPRYLRPEFIEDPLHMVQESYARGEKVLWILNTVGRAREAFLACRALGLPAILYHSRYKYPDRLQHHEAVIKAFNSSGPAVAICTQVAEMSLDISADVLISDLCPVCFFIQRLGRLNRFGGLADGLLPKPAYIVVPMRDGKEFTKPYSKSEFELVRKWLMMLPKRKKALSQKDVADAWAKVDAGRSIPFEHGAWYSGGFSTMVDPLREATPGYSVILSEDFEDVRQHRVRVLEVAVQMTTPTAPGEIWHGFLVATEEQISYDPVLGGQWL